MSDWNKMDWKRYELEDPLGFTKQTAMMLIGLGAGDLIPEFKKRNISSRNLVELNKKDLIILGANEKLADRMLTDLRSAAKKFTCENLIDERRWNETTKVLTGGNNQLNLLETFVAYARLRLAEKTDDFVIDSKRNIRASQALCAATLHTIRELEQLERNWKQLTHELTDDDQRQGKKMCLLKLITGIGLIGSVAFAFKRFSIPLATT